MLILILTVCLLDGSQPCRDESLGAVEALPFRCAQIGQVEAARWAAEHPAYRVAGYRCGRPERSA